MPKKRPITATLLVFGLIAASQPLDAQAPRYSFTRIADSVNDDAGLGGATCVGLNALGTVIVIFAPTGADFYQLWRGDGNTFTQVADKVGLCASINDSDEMAYMVPGQTNETLLVKNSGGALTTLASSFASPALGPDTHTSLSNSGSAVFQSPGGLDPSFGAGIYIGPSGTAVYNSKIHLPLTSFATSSMNDGLTVAFRATSGSRAGIYRSSDVALIEDGDVVTGGTMTVSPFYLPVINNSDRVAFVGSTGSGATVYTTFDGVSVNAVGTNPAAGAGGLSINDSGTVAFRKGSGPGSGILAGRPGSIDRKVVFTGDPIDGSTLNDAFLWEEAINNNGQIAFRAQLADGRTGVYRAEPEWLKSLSFTSKVPGCGPIQGKVTLLGPAPPGGLEVTLQDTHAAASVPPTVTVPAGKQSKTFQITTTAVATKTVGDITASVGSQSLDRALTVRPIGVKSLSLAPNPVPGGNGVTGTVKLECDAAPADITAALSSTKPAIANPDVNSLLFPAGTDTQTFSITTATVPTTTNVTIKASANGITKSKKLTVTP